ncbi:phosphotransferase [Cytobacillus eiseniae]|nr:phosphotransferase [Cytobacillus eiseniae]
MKAVNLTYKNGGDDLFLNRLFAYLQYKLTVQIEDIVPIRKRVFKVKTVDFDFILKGYSSYHQLIVQDEFTASLKKEGFLQTYNFHPLIVEGPLFMDQWYFGCLEYLPPSENVFSFHKKQDRIQGLELLAKFHDATEEIAEQSRIRVPVFNQLEKWQERTAIFLSNLPIIRYYVQKEIINEWLIWADWSLKGLHKEDIFEKGRRVILHGDVAHHNFLRVMNEDLYLIDFDLISLGHPLSDYLQYANRILPFLNWSLDELSNLCAFEKYLDEKAFIYALAFPTDIFREWNRAIMEKTYVQPEKIKQLLKATVAPFQQRQNFFYQLQQLQEI